MVKGWNMRHFRPLMIALFMWMIGFSNDLQAQEPSDEKPHIEWQTIQPDENGEPVSLNTWSPDSAYIAGTDYVHEEILIFSIAESRVIRRLALPAWDKKFNLFASTFWSPNGDYFALALGGQSYVLDAKTGALVSKLKPSSSEDRPRMGIVDVRWSKDSTRVAALSWNGFITVFDAMSGEVTLTIDLNDGVRSSMAYPIFDWSSDNSRFVAIYQDNDLAVWDSEGNLLTDTPETRGCSGGLGDFPQTGNNVAWANDNRTLLVSGQYLVICRFDGLTLSQIGNAISYHSSGEGQQVSYSVSPAAWSPDQQWIVGAIRGGLDLTDPYSCQLRFFDVERDMALSRIDKGICGYLTWSPNGHYIIVNSANSKDIWLGTILQD
jgi:WD40 repeat protein